MEFQMIAYFTDPKLCMPTIYSDIIMAKESISCLTKAWINNLTALIRVWGHLAAMSTSVRT